jgi:hypothetical protein
LLGVTLQNQKNKFWNQLGAKLGIYQETDWLQPTHKENMVC